MKCYCCKDELNLANTSEEHILLNAIGGKLKSKNLLCKDCNSNFGKRFDGELAKQLEFLGSFLNIKRERGNHPTIKNAKTSDGQDIHLLAGGKPYFSKPIVEQVQDGDELRISIAARNDKELKNIAEGINRRYPIIPIKTIVDNAVHHKVYFDKPIQVNQVIGGQKSLNAIIKIALNYYIFKTKCFSLVEDTIEILKNETNNKLCKHFYKKQLYKKDKGEVCHFIHVESNKTNGNLIGYVELYSAFSFLILLSRNFQGKNVKYTYAYDVLKNKEISKDISLKISNDKFDNLPVFSIGNISTITEKLDRLVKIGLENQAINEMSDIYERCFNHIFNEKYAGVNIDKKKLLTEFSEYTAQELIRFIYRDNSKLKSSEF